MSISLQKLMESDWFGSEKTASAEDADMDKLAQELGMFNEKVAEEEEEEEEEEEGEEEEKQASSLSLYDYIKGSGGSKSSVKTAAELREMKIGGRSFDHFEANRLARMAKLAEGVLTGDATIASPLAAQGDEPSGDDSTPPQNNETNRPDDASDAIDTTPDVENILPPEDKDRTVGDEKTAALAFRKHLLLARLGK